MKNTTETIDLRSVVIDTLTEEVGDNNKNVVVVVSDSTTTSKIKPFQEKFPERVVNVGIAEQNLVGVAAGLSLGGFTAITANAAPFLVARSNEQIKSDICYSNTNVKLIGLNAGVCYGSLGSTHHAIDDVSIMRGFGNITILAPSDPVETEKILKYSLDYTGPVYIRLDNGKFPVLHDKSYTFTPGEVDVLREGDDVTLIGMGSTVHEAYAAAGELESHGINADVLNISSIRPLKPEKIIASIKKTKKVITVEEHSLHGGLAAVISGIIAEYGLAVEMKKLGIPEGQFAKAGPRDELRKYYGIDKEGILATCLALLSKEKTIVNGAN